MTTRVIKTDSTSVLIVSDPEIQTIETEQPHSYITSHGVEGPAGISAYQEALNQGFVGTRSEWIDSLKGSSAYQIALNNGFVGTEQEWLDSLKADGGITVRAEDANKILSNDGSVTQWDTIENKLNSESIQWDLGEFV